MLDEETEENLANFVLELYMKERPQSVTKLGALRWHLFSIHQSESNRLTTTYKAFRQIMMRAHFIALQWKSSHLPSPELPDPNEYGWIWDENKEIFEPVMTTNPPAPDSIMELTSCGCKTGCQTDRCRCRKNELLYTEICRCKDCENTDIEFDKPDYVADLDSDD